jgi:hypothetical protein
MNNNHFSRIRAFAGPNALEPSRNPVSNTSPDPNILDGVLEGLRIVTGYIPSSGTVTDPSRGFTSTYDPGSNIYTVTLVPPFSDLLYTVNVTSSTSNPLFMPSVLNQTNGTFNVQLFDITIGLPNPVPANFYFTAIGN